MSAGVVQRPSPLELVLWNRIERAGLPLPVQEYPFAKELGRKFRFDGAYVAVRIAVEVEGGTWANGRHSRGSGFEKDAEKYNLAALMGWRVLRFNDHMIKDGRAVETIRQALAGPEAGRGEEDV